MHLGTEDIIWKKKIKKKRKVPTCRLLKYKNHLFLSSSSPSPVLLLSPPPKPVFFTVLVKYFTVSQVFSNEDLIGKCQVLLYYTLSILLRE